MITIPEDILRVVDGASLSYGIERVLILAIAQVESTMNPNALGDYDEHGVPHSFGLMQLNDMGAGYGYTRDELLDLERNVDLGCKYLRSCFNAFPGDMNTAISAYNQGIAGARERGWTFNQGYVLDVLHWRSRFVDEGVDPGPTWPDRPGCWSLGLF